MSYGSFEPAPTVPPTPWWVWLAAAAFVPACAGATWYWVSDLSEFTYADSRDYVWRPWTPLVEHAALVGIGSTTVLVGTVTVLAAARRRAAMSAPALTGVVVLALFAAWLALAYRIMTAAVMGANIGAGMVMLATPGVAAGAMTGLVLCWRWGRRANHGLRAPHEGTFSPRFGALTRRR